MKRAWIRARSQTKTARLRRECDRLFQEWIRGVFRGRCAKCGVPFGAAHHIMGKRFYHLRYELRNGVYLCNLCHVHYAHAKPEAFLNWLKHELPLHYKFYEDHRGDSEGTKLTSWYLDQREVLKDKLGET